jgi:hypothetical protein
LDSNVHDDARQGIAMLSSLESDSSILQSMLSELRILFALNVAVSLTVRAAHFSALLTAEYSSRFQVLYYLTFLRTVSSVVQQVGVALACARCSL